MRHFYAWCPDYSQTEDDARAVSIAIGGPREAACEWAECDDRDSVEYRIVGGNSALILVREKETGHLSAWRVDGESIPIYHGRPAELPKTA